MSASATPSPNPHLLFVDDEHLLHNVLTRLFARHQIDVTCCSDAATAIEKLDAEAFDLVITDFKMPQMDGLELLAHIRKTHPQMRAIMITAHGSIQHAVRSMRHGAIDYIPKPFSTTELVDRVKKLLATPVADEAAPAPAAGSTPASAQPKPKAPARTGTSNASQDAAAARYIGDHDSIQRLKALLPRVAESRAPVFVHGESGTGKEILSRIIHDMSDRAEGPYVALNCANLPSELVESHLFGHRKGAFTGAIADMTGAFEQADGGTLLLDEITEVAPNVQAKLLRVLQEQEIQRVGDAETKQVDVRIVATSNRDLQEAVDEGLFREDLYHRLAVFPVTVPPLRDRLSDVPALAEHFVEKYVTLYGLPEKDIASDLMRRFRSYSWPGNVRQLENMVHRGVVLSAERGEIALDDVVNDFFSEGATSERQAPAYTASTGDGAMTLEEIERHAILQALEQTDSNQKQAAEQLGICARTIRNKLKKYREEGYFV